jgi:hypothetical protein
MIDGMQLVELVMRDGESEVTITRSAGEPRCHTDTLANMALDAFEANPRPSRNVAFVFALADLIETLGMTLEAVLPSSAAFWSIERLRWRAVTVARQHEPEPRTAP